jgi:hypothetical protein
MITSPNPYWWQVHFSYLGASGTVSALAFNLTLIIGGLVIVCLADFVAADFARLQAVQETRAARAKVNSIRIALAAIGVLLACVGIFEYDVYPALHGLAAGGMAIVFMGLVVGLPLLAPGFTRAFFAFSYAMMGVLLVCNWLMMGLGKLNLTTFELICGAVIFAWMVVFVRNLAVESGAAGVADGAYT